MVTNERRGRILELVAEFYIRSAHPVPSSTIAERLDLSSATVRNEFAALEEEGLLHQPHTSAGRIPTSLGFRRYAGQHIPPRPLRSRDAKRLTRRLQDLHGSELLRTLASLAADLSGYAVVLELPAHDAVRALEVHLTPLSEGRVLAVAVLENGLTRQLMVPLTPAPTEDVLEDAERTLRQMTVPLKEVPVALHSLARQAEDELRRTLRALADAWPTLHPPEVVSHGLSLLFDEPESRDPAFLRRAALRLEKGGGPRLDRVEGPLGLAFDEDLALIGAELALAPSEGRLTLVGPARMRYADAFAVAGGVSRTVAALGNAA